MKPIKTPLEAAAGKLNSAIQKEWIEESGTSTGDEAERVMHHSHNLLKVLRRTQSLWYLEAAQWQSFSAKHGSHRTLVYSRM